jgi:hypothetical protein
MQARMGTTLTYRHEDGINWNYVLPDLIVGSCLQGPEDVDRLQAAGVTTVFSLQVKGGGRNQLTPHSLVWRPSTQVNCSLLAGLGQSGHMVCWPQQNKHR